MFSNEAGIGSASMTHTAIKTNEPVTESVIPVLESFIETIVICTITGLVIGTAQVAGPNFANGDQGVAIPLRHLSENLVGFVVLFWAQELDLFIRRK